VRAGEATIRRLQLTVPGLLQAYEEPLSWALLS